MPRTDWNIRNLLLKFGTSTLAPSGNLDQEIFDLIAMLVVQVEKLGIKVTIVTSGAILAGKERAEYLGEDIALMKNRYKAANGGHHLNIMWDLAFGKYRREIAPILISHANLKDKDGHRSIQVGIRELLKFGFVPIVNENDFVSDKEVKDMKRGISENDKLSEKLAGVIGADSILFLTNKKGIYEQNPDAKNDVRCYREIDVTTAVKLARKSAGSSQNGTGGMSAKLHAGIECYRKGMKTCIAKLSDDAILKFARGEQVGTMFGSSVSFW